jgi:pimeloyl-ACP methyl ester carboxylesterase
LTAFFEYRNSHYGAQKLAYVKNNGQAPGLIFLPGFKSDLTGTKAEAVADWAIRHEHTCLRFDYFGHGQSSGDFRAGTISGWREEVTTVIDALTAGPQILIGSSFGGFMATLAALDRPERITALVLIAPAFDMTERLMRAALSAEELAAMARDGFVQRHSDYDDEGYPITAKLLEDGKSHCILQATIPLSIPIRILHGQQDDAVPWQLSQEFATRCTSNDIELHFFKSGDHRLSSPSEIAALTAMLQRLKDQIGTP